MAFNRVFIVASDDRLSAQIAKDLAALNVRTVHVPTLSESRLCESNSDPAVILCDADSINWRRALQFVAAHTRSWPVVFLTRLADDSLWIEMLQSGAFDLLERPYRTKDLCWVIQTALRHSGPQKSSVWHAA